MAESEGKETEKPAEKTTQDKNIKKWWAEQPKWEKAGVIIGAAALVVAGLIYWNSRNSNATPNTTNSVTPGSSYPTGYPGEGEYYPSLPPPTTTGSGTPTPTPSPSPPSNPSPTKPAPSPIGSRPFLPGGGAPPGKYHPLGTVAHKTAMAGHNAAGDANLSRSIAPGYWQTSKAVNQIFSNPFRGGKSGGAGGLMSV